MKPTPDFSPVVEATAREYGLTREALMGPSRKGPVMEARMIALYLARKTGSTLEYVGTWFGRDHVAVSYASHTIADRMSIYPKVKARVERIETAVKGEAK